MEKEKGNASEEARRKKKRAVVLFFFSRHAIRPRGRGFLVSFKITNPRCSSLCLPAVRCNVAKCWRAHLGKEEEAEVEEAKSPLKARERERGRKSSEKKFQWVVACVLVVATSSSSFFVSPFFYLFFFTYRFLLFTPPPPPPPTRPLPPPSPFPRSTRRPPRSRRPASSRKAHQKASTL